MGALSVENLIADVESLREALGHQRLTIFGHSWGSLLAQLYYVAHPARVKTLILSGAFPPAADLEALGRQAQERQRQLMTRPEVAQAVREAGIDPDASHLPPRDRRSYRMVTGQASFAVWDMSKWPHVRDVRFDRANAIAIDESLPASYDISTTLTANPVPVTILQGEHDYVDPAASTWKTLDKTHEGIHVEVIPAAIHNPWLDHPRHFAEGLRRGLDRAHE